MFFDNILILMLLIKFNNFIQVFIRTFKIKNRIHIKNNIKKIDHFCDISILINSIKDF